jgi:hypothetical protein
MLVRIERLSLFDACCDPSMHAFLHPDCSSHCAHSTGLIVSEIMSVSGKSIDSDPEEVCLVRAARGAAVVHTLLTVSWLFMAPPPPPDYSPAIAG